MTYLISSRLGGELVGRGSGLDTETDDAGDPRARAALPGDAAPTLNAAQLEAVTATEGYVRVMLVRERARRARLRSALHTW